MSIEYNEQSYASIIAGEVDIPNFEPVTPEYFCNALASGGHSMVPKWGHAKGERGHKPWAHYFLTNYSNMGSGLDGSGLVTIYGGDKPKVGRFAICKHEKKLGGRRQSLTRMESWRLHEVRPQHDHRQRRLR
jgi:hypothetical protein